MRVDPALPFGRLQAEWRRPLSWVLMCIEEYTEAKHLHVDLSRSLDRQIFDILTLGTTTRPEDSYVDVVTQARERQTSWSTLSESTLCGAFQHTISSVSPSRSLLRTQTVATRDHVFGSTASA